MATDEPTHSGVAGRYASALFELAGEQGQVSDIERDLATFLELYEASPDLQRAVLSPVIPADEQAGALSAVLERFGARPLTVNFFKLIARNRRLFAAADMVRAYRALAARARGEVAAEVASAHPLTDSQVRALKDVLRASMGKEVTLAAKVDPSLIGGLVVKVGSRMVDSSLRTKLKGLKHTLKGA